MFHVKHLTISASQTHDPHHERPLNANAPRLLLIAYVASAATLSCSTPTPQNAEASPTETRPTSGATSSSGADTSTGEDPEDDGLLPDGEPLMDPEQRRALLAYGLLGDVHVDCLDDERCITSGECGKSPYDTECYAFADDCSATAACALIGACAQVDEVNAYSGAGTGACLPTEDAHCRASLACSSEGKCVAVSHWDRFSCDARLDADCAASDACVADGECTAFEGACVTEVAANAACAERPACANDGIDCQPIDGRCRNPTGFDCSKTSACAGGGRCASTVEDAGGGPFVACHHSVDYCEARPECAERGICGVTISSDHGNGDYKGGCMLEGPTGCDEDYTWSACATTEAGCAASARCASHGDCSAASPSSYCHPSEDIHCRASENCAKHGFCAAADESSYMVCSN